MLKQTVKSEDKNCTLITYLKALLRHAPPAYLRQLIRSGKIKLNGARAQEEQHLQAGDVVSLPASQRMTALLAAEKRAPRILYESDEILIVHKPANLATHSSKNHEQNNLVNSVSQEMRAAGKKYKIAAIHRLDLPTSGPIIFGKGQKAISTLGKMMQDNRISKKYLALVRGGLPTKGILSSHIASKGKIKHAETTYAVRADNSDFALIELELQTGRQHQIRKQLAERGFPIAGDIRYRGPRCHNLERLFLHCHFLEFFNPFTDQKITIEDPLPLPLADVLSSLGLVCNSDHLH